MPCESCGKTEKNTQLKSAYLKSLRTLFDDPRSKWDFKRLSLNPSITYSVVSMFPMLPWNYNNLSYNHSITYKDVLEDPDKPWNYQCLSYNTSITYKDVYKNVELQ
jgi:hemolysin activation/secretion protein